MLKNIGIFHKEHQTLSSKIFLFYCIKRLLIGSESLGLEAIVGVVLFLEEGGGGGTVLYSQWSSC